MGEPARRSRNTIWLALLALVALASAAVVVKLTRSPSGNAAAGTPSSAPSPSPASSPTTALDPQAATKAAVIAAYTQSFQAIIVVGKGASPSPDDPRLSEHTSGPALVAMQRAIVDNNAKGLVYAGDAEVHPSVIDLTATSATVIDCALDRTALVERRTGSTVVDAGPNTGIAATAQLSLQGGVWRVTDFTNEKRSCAVPAA